MLTLGTGAYLNFISNPRCRSFSEGLNASGRLALNFSKELLVFIMVGYATVLHLTSLGITVSY